MSLLGATWKLRPCAVVLCLGLSVNLPASADEGASENARLAAVLRQLDLLDRLADQSAQVSPAASRYHFDYQRLHADIARVRAGIEDYLSPRRAQPRDVALLSGAYRRDESGTP